MFEKIKELQEQITSSKEEFEQMKVDYRNREREIIDEINDLLKPFKIIVIDYKMHINSLKKHYEENIPSWNIKGDNFYYKIYSFEITDYNNNKIMDIKNLEKALKEIKSSLGVIVEDILQFFQNELNQTEQNKLKYKRDHNL